MAIDETSLLSEADNIYQKGQGLSHYDLSFRILAGRKWIDPLLITQQNVERDYESGYAEAMVLTFELGAGAYAYNILAARDELWVDLVTIPVYADTNVQRDGTKSTSERFKAILMNQDNPSLAGRDPQASSEGDMDLGGLVQVQLQLISQAAYQVRAMSFGRGYRNQTPFDVLYSALTETTKLVSTNNQQMIFGVDPIPGHNETPRATIPIPDGTSLLALPRILQEEEGGIYPAGLGCFLQAGQWHLFPPYDTKRYKTTPRVLTIIVVPSNRHFGSERTYRRTSNQVVIVSSSGGQVSDQGFNEQLADGNAVRFTDANKVISGDMAFENNKALMDRSKNLFEFTGGAFKDGTNNTQWASQRATANPFKHYSELAKRKGQYVTREWLHGDADLLDPGMVVKYMVASNGLVKTYYGVLLGTFETRIPRNPGPVPEGFPSSIQLKLFLSREPEL